MQLGSIHVRPGYLCIPRLRSPTFSQYPNGYPRPASTSEHQAAVTADTTSAFTRAEGTTSLPVTRELRTGDAGTTQRREWVLRASAADRLLGALIRKEG